MRLLPSGSKRAAQQHPSRRAGPFFLLSQPTAGGQQRHASLSPCAATFPETGRRRRKALRLLPLDRGAFIYAFLHFYIFTYMCFCLFRREKPRARLLLQGPRPAHARGCLFQTAKNGRGFRLSRFLPCPSPPACTPRRGGHRQLFCLRIQKLLKENLPEESNPYQSSPAVGVVKI